MANLQNNWQNISLSHMHFRQTQKQLQSTYNFCQLCDYITVHVLSCRLLNTEDHGHFTWDLWCIKWYRDRSFLEHLAFLLSIQFQHRFLFYSYINCVMNSGCNCSCIFPPHKKLITISSIDCPQVYCSFHSWIHRNMTYFRTAAASTKLHYGKLSLITTEVYHCILAVWNTMKHGILRDQK